MRPDEKSNNMNLWKDSGGLGSASQHLKTASQTSDSFRAKGPRKSPAEVV